MIKEDHINNTREQNSKYGTIHWQLGVLQQIPFLKS